MIEQFCWLCNHKIDDLNDPYNLVIEQFCCLCDHKIDLCDLIDPCDLCDPHDLSDPFALSDHHSTRKQAH